MFLECNTFYKVVNAVELNVFLRSLPQPPMQGFFVKKDGINIINIAKIPEDDRIIFTCYHDRRFSFAAKCKITQHGAECLEHDINFSQDNLLLLLSLGLEEFSFLPTYTMAQSDDFKAICMNFQQK